MLNLEILRLRLAKANLIIFNSLIIGNSCISAPKSGRQTLCTTQNNKPVIATDIAGAETRAHYFPGKFSSLWNASPQPLRLLSPPSPKTQSGDF